MINGGILTITTKNVRDKLLISIKDNGIGIPLIQLPRIFDPFFSTKAQGEGTGLGLSVCHGIIMSHKGTIKAESNPGEGTLITITFQVK